MKRIEKFNFNSVAKKPKIQEDDDVWGDDLEFDEVDRCLTQLETQNDTQTTYENFKNRANACSTQAFLIPQAPSTSKNYQLQTQRNLSQISSTSVTTVISKNVTPQEFQQKLLGDIKKLEEQNKLLSEQYKTKDGEISILRMQLKQAQKTADSEKMQKMQQTDKINQHWSEKFNGVYKEKDNIKNELDLKNLEIVNLREKLRDFKFENRNLNNSFSTSISCSHRNKRFCENSTSASKKHNTGVQTEDKAVNNVPTTSHLRYPLQKIIPEYFFNKQRQEHCEVIKIHSNNINGTFFKLNTLQYGNVIDFKPPKINKIILSTEYFFTELVLLMKCTEFELNSESIKTHVDKIIFVTNNLLTNALTKLKQVEENLSNEDLRHMNEQYLYRKLDRCDENKKFCIFTKRPWSEEELLIELRRSLAVLSVIAIFNIYLLKYLTNVSQKDKFSPSNRAISFIDLTKENEQKCDILDNILEITKIIGKIRKSHQFSGFLSSVLFLLENLLTHIELSPNCYLVLHSIFQEVVFSRPNAQVLRYMSGLLRRIAFHSPFLSLCCKNAKQTSFRQSNNSFNFTQDTCTFQVLIILLETFELNVSFVYDVFSFLNIALTTHCNWFHSQETIRCQCLCRFCTSSVDIIYNLMKDFKENIQELSTKKLRIYNSLFQRGLNVLNVLTHRYADAILESFKTHSQNLIWLKNMSEMDKHLKYNSSQEIIKETLLASICNNELSEEESSRKNETVFRQKKARIINNILF